VRSKQGIHRAGVMASLSEHDKIFNWPIKNSHHN
jgi:hypothetical protein